MQPMNPITNADVSNPESHGREQRLKNISPEQTAFVDAVYANIIRTDNEFGTMHDRPYDDTSPGILLSWMEEPTDKAALRIAQNLPSIGLEASQRALQELDICPGYTIFAYPRNIHGPLSEQSNAYSRQLNMIATTLLAIPDIEPIWKDLAYEEKILLINFAMEVNQRVQLQIELIQEGNNKADIKGTKNPAKLLNYPDTVLKRYFPKGFGEIGRHTQSMQIAALLLNISGNDTPSGLAYDFGPEINRKKNLYYSRDSVELPQNIRF